MRSIIDHTKKHTKETVVPQPEQSTQPAQVCHGACRRHLVRVAKLLEYQYNMTLNRLQKGGFSVKYSICYVLCGLLLIMYTLVHAQ